MGADRHFNAGDFFSLKSLMQLLVDFLTVKIPFNFQCTELLVLTVPICLYFFFSLNPFDICVSILEGGWQL